MRNAGLQWKERNGEALKLLTIPSKVLSWDHYLESDEYTEKREFIDGLCIKDEKFKKALDNTARRSLKQYGKDNSKINLTIGNMQRAFDNSLEYFKEECSVWLLWAELEKPNFLVYPSKLSESLSYVRKFFPDIQNKNIITLQPLVISFQKVKNLITLSSQPQNGHAYVSRYMSGAPPNPAMFFQAQPPVNVTMSRSKLHEFIERHLQLTMEFAKSMDDPKARFEFLKLSFAHMGTIIYPITVTDDSDNASNSNDHDHDNGSSPESSLQMNSK